MDVTMVIGNRAKVTATFRDASGALADPGVVTGKTIEPDGQTITTYVYGAAPANLTRTSQGIYVLEFDLTEVGKWGVRLIGSGSGVTAAAEGHVMVPDSPFAAP